MVFFIYWSCAPCVGPFVGPKLTYELWHFYTVYLRQSGTLFNTCPALGYVVSLKSFCVTDNPPWRGIRVPTGYVSSFWSSLRSNFMRLWGYQGLLVLCALLSQRDIAIKLWNSNLMLIYSYILQLCTLYQGLNFTVFRSVPAGHQGWKISVSDPKCRCLDNYLGSNLIVFGRCLPGTEP